jgi:hypothetical protein
MLEIVLLLAVFVASATAADTTTDAPAGFVGGLDPELYDSLISEYAGLTDDAAISSYLKTLTKDLSHYYAQNSALIAQYSSLYESLYGPSWSQTFASQLAAATNGQFANSDYLSAYYSELSALGGVDATATASAASLVTSIAAAAQSAGSAISSATSALESAASSAASNSGSTSATSSRSSLSNSSSGGALSTSASSKAVGADVVVPMIGVLGAFVAALV